MLDTVGSLPEDRGLAPSEAAGACLPPVVVGIGASAGGLEALKQFFAALPIQSNLCFLVAMHLPPDGTSYLAGILKRFTPLRVLPAEQAVRLAPDTVLVVPPGRNLALTGGEVSLAASPDFKNRHFPVNHLFCSLAASLKERAVALVLSGYGFDGTEGARAIKDAGGMVLAQDPESALNPGMPTSAIAANAVDVVLPADQLARRLAAFASNGALPPQAPSVSLQPEAELDAILSRVQAVFGWDFRSLRREVLLRRVSRRVSVTHSGDLKRYLALLSADELEARALGEGILAGPARFFSDRDAFRYLGEKVIPHLVEGGEPGRALRIWHSCCASGEETYSLAILIRECLERRGILRSVKIFATDSDANALAQAKAGLYAGIEEDLGEERLGRHFSRAGNFWQVSRALQEMIIFGRHSVEADPPFARIDLLVCRNYLGFLSPDRRQGLLSHFHSVLRPGGLLFLARDEVLRDECPLFSQPEAEGSFLQRLELRQLPGPAAPPSKEALARTESPEGEHLDGRVPGRSEDETSQGTLFPALRLGEPKFGARARRLAGAGAAGTFQRGFFHLHPGPRLRRTGRGFEERDPSGLPAPDLGGVSPHPAPARHGRTRGGQRPDRAPARRG